MYSREKSGFKMNKILIVLGVLIIAGLSSIYWFYAEGEKPRISFSPKKGYITDKTEFTLQVKDTGSSLSFLSVRLVQKDQKIELFQKSFQKQVPKVTKEFQLSKYGIQNGPVQIRVKARDSSWQNWFKGNLAKKGFSYNLDTEPPKINLQSYTHNLEIGGSGVVGFTVSEPVQKVGVQVQDFFFPAYSPTGKDIYLCFFSCPYDYSSQDGKILIKAVDRAGNMDKTGFNYYISRENFRKSTFRITPGFLKRKMPGFQSLFPDAENRLQVFIKVNRDLRKKNREELLQIGKKTSEKPLWSGKFTRLPNSAHMSSFGTYRKYVYQGKKIDSQRHLGVDLASVSGARVPAANDGKVIYTGRLGIFGRVIIIDHGMGLQSMYAHLSQIKVQNKQEVSKGEIIAHTGATGLARGDHLHFAILISGVPVNPVEWWDKTWIKHNVAPKLDLIRQSQRENQ